MNSKPIGVFDSGLGGLTVVKELIKQLPRESIVYFGDTARVPYGNKSKDTIVRFSLENILFLLKQEVKLIIVACNTASSLALPSIRKHFTVPLVGVIVPGAKDAVRHSRNHRIGVIGTRSTISSKAYDKEIYKIDAKAKVFTKSCPLFVPLVEEGMLSGKITSDVICDYLKPLKKKGVDTVILGCTHYPLLKKSISKVLGKDIELVDSAQQVVREVKEQLKADSALSGLKARKDIFYVTDEPSAFLKTAQVFLGKPLSRVRRVKNV